MGDNDENGERQRLSISTIVGSVSLVGIASQGAAYSAARGFYAAFGLAPEQLGVTPVGALLRLNSTATGAALAISILVAMGSAVYTRPLKPRTRQRSVGREGRHRWVPSLEELKSSIRRSKRATIFVWSATMLSIFVFVLFMSYFLGLGAGRQSASLVESLVPSFNPVNLDLNPPLVRARWTKPEERPPEIARTADPELGDIILGRYLGTFNGVTYLHDFLSERTVAVPATQVQLFISGQ